jgi:hypothetical protein
MLAERLKTVATSTVEAAVVAEVLKCKWSKELLTILLNVQCIVWNLLTAFQV